jgi:HNH endonuclease
MATLKKIMISRIIKERSFLTIQIDTIEVLDEDSSGKAFTKALRQACREKNYKLKFYTVSKDLNFDYEAVVHPETKLIDFKINSMQEVSQYFGYKIIEKYCLSHLEQYKYKYRSKLRVFYHKGTTCANCGITGAYIGKGLDNKGRIHLNVYTDDLIPLTLDHILPKSKGGSNASHNLQTMCYPCNYTKQNKIPNN